MLMTIHQRIKQLRQAHGWFQKELADKLGVAVVTVKKWEEGRAVPDSPNRKKLTTVFRITEGDLFTSGEEHPKQGLTTHLGVSPQDLSALSQEDVGLLQLFMKLLVKRAPRPIKTGSPVKKITKSMSHMHVTRELNGHDLQTIHAR